MTILNIKNNGQETSKCLVILKFDESVYECISEIQLLIGFFKLLNFYISINSFDKNVSSILKI